MNFSLPLRGVYLECNIEFSPFLSLSLFTGTFFLRWGGVEHSKLKYLFEDEITWCEGWPRIWRTTREQRTGLLSSNIVCAAHDSWPFGMVIQGNVWVRGVLSRYLSIFEGFVEALYFYRVLSLSAGFENITENSNSERKNMALKLSNSLRLLKMIFLDSHSIVILQGSSLQMEYVTGSISCLQFQLK